VFPEDPEHLEDLEHPESRQYHLDPEFLVVLVCLEDLEHLGLKDPVFLEDLVFPAILVHLGIRQYHLDPAFLVVLVCLEDLEHLGC
jgi:hypothetical protein